MKSLGFNTYNSNIKYVYTNDTPTEYSARKIISTQNVTNGETSEYTAGEINLQPGFTIEPGAEFEAIATGDDTQTAFSYINTKELTEKNYCFIFRPFSLINNPGSSYLIDGEWKNTPDACVFPTSLKSFQFEDFDYNTYDTKYFYKEKINTINIIETTNSENLLLYPNPANEKIIIIHQKEVKNITLYSSNGEIFYKILNNNETQTILNLMSFPTGIYYVQLDNESLQKFIKE